jgi:uncharacterized protein YeaO (DUF488 family)
MATKFRLKRIYEPAEKDDGFRALVDRLWPRGLSKAEAKIDVWLKEIAPSDDLRHRLHGDPEKWKTFVAAYGKELKQPEAEDASALLRKQLRKGPVTLLYAARDEEHNNAVALKYWLERRR